MFKNAGRKIMTVVNVVFWVLVAIGAFLLITGFFAMGFGREIDALIGSIFLIVGAIMIVIAYVQCLFYAAFAQLTENVQRMEGSLQRLGGGIPAGVQPISAQPWPVPPGPPACPNCGTQLRSDAAFCPNCGTKVN